MTQQIFSDWTRRDFLRSTGMLAGGLVVIGAGSCGSGDAASTDGQGASKSRYSGALPTSGWTSIVNNAPLIIGVKKGIFSDHGLDFEPLNLGGSDVVRAVIQSADVGAPSAVSCMSVYSQGQQDIRLVGNLYNVTTALQIVPGGSDIESVEDLKGKTIAITGPGGASELLARKMLEDAGLTLGEDVEFVNIAGFPDAWTAATQGLVDATHSAIPFATEFLQSGEARILATLNDYYPDYSDVGLASTAQFIEENPDAVQRFVAATADSISFLRSETDEAVEIYAQEAEITPEVAEGALMWTGSLDIYDISFNDPGLKAVAEAGILMEQIDSAGFAPDDVESIVVRDFVDALS